MKVQLIRNYRKLKAGQFAEINGGVASVLIKRGFVKDVSATPEADSVSIASDGAGDDPRSEETPKHRNKRQYTRRVPVQQDNVGS